MFGARGLVLDCTDGVGPPFSCFTLPDSFSTVPRSPGPVFMFGARRLILGCTECVGSHFHVLRSRTHLGRYRGRQVLFTCSALLESFSTILRVSGPVFMFCPPGLVFDVTEGVRLRLHVCAFELIFDSTEGVEYRCHVLRTRTSFCLCRGRRDSFSCFTLSDSFSMEPRASGLIFMFCASGPIFGETEGVRSRLHILHS
jgi:hypothetical protein